MAAPELSIIIPTLNEALALPECLTMLARQRGSAFEVLICDGGSTDGTLTVAAALSTTFPFPCRIYSSAPGRGLQMNCGAAHAAAATLLFLHADCSFADETALQIALEQLSVAEEQAQDGVLALRFSLCFADDGGFPAAARRFYQHKARLARLGCIHGDQGFMLRTRVFDELGGFATSLPYLEDDRLAAAVAARGGWLLSPAVIITSSRRFAAAGWRRRQFLNALILCAEASGWQQLLVLLPQLYRVGGGERADFALLLGQVAEELARLPASERRRLWFSAGEYVRSNAWQLALWWGLVWQPDSAAATVACFERHWERFTANPVGRGLATLLLVMVVKGGFLWARVRRSGQGPNLR